MESFGCRLISPGDLSHLPLGRIELHVARIIVRGYHHKTALNTGSPRRSRGARYTDSPTGSYVRSATWIGMRE
jgi:hypothetical protein